MMKKVLQSLIILGVLFTASTDARNKKACPSKQKSAQLRQERAKARAEKKERSRLACSRKKAANNQRKEERAKARAVKKHKMEKAKALKMQQKQADKGWWNKFWEKEERAKAKKEKLVIAATKREQHKQERAVAKKMRSYEIAAQEQAAAEARKARTEKLLREKKEAPIRREKLMAAWKEARGQELAEDYKDGMYADLYKIPAWPFHMMFAEYKKDLFQVTAKYNYATDSYSSGGSSKDLSSLAFGENSFNFSDILLALKLNNKEILTRNTAISEVWNNLIGFDQIEQTIFAYNKDLVFNARSEEYGLSLDYLRYLKGHDIAIGFQLPIAYKAHKLKFSSPVGSNTAKSTRIESNNIGDPDPTMIYETWSNVPSQTYLNEYLNFVLAPKKLTYLPKTSVTGIGDLSTFLTMQIGCRFFEKWLAGFKVLWPTAKAADTNKLWAPTLGNGGFTELTAYTSMLFNHQTQYFNPHFFLQGTYKLRGHVDRRIPKFVSATGGGEGNSETTTSDGRRLEDIMAHGDKVKFVTDTGTAATTFTNYPDSTIAAFADNVANVQIRPGAEFNFRLGNIFEKFIFRRAFLDIFYDFKARLKDTIGGSLPRDIWNVDILRDRTNQIAHKLGFLYDYQFDYQTRLRLGLNYTFAGINVPADVEGKLSVDVEF